MELYEEVPHLPGVYRRKLNSAVRVDSCLKATTIPPYHIHITSPHDKAYLLGQDSTDYASRTAGEHKILEAAIKIDPCSADWYGLKVTAITELPCQPLSDQFAWMSRIWNLNEGTHGNVMLISKTGLAGKHSLRTVNRRIFQIH